MWRRTETGQIFLDTVTARTCLTRVSVRGKGSSGMSHVHPNIDIGVFRCITYRQTATSYCSTVICTCNLIHLLSGQNEQSKGVGNGGNENGLAKDRKRWQPKQLRRMEFTVDTRGHMAAGVLSV